MASIRKRGNGWRVQVRRQGFHPITATFASKAEAFCWASEQEQSMTGNGHSLPSGSYVKVTVAELLRRYEATVSAAKRGASREAFKIRVLLRSPLADLELLRLTSSMIAAYRDSRLNVVKPATVRRELAVLRHCLEVARLEWGMPLRKNPFADVKLPSTANSRDRRFDAHDERKLMDVMTSRKAWYLEPLIQLAIETGMRRGELLSLEWTHLDFQMRIATLTMTKNGSLRRVPLSTKAVSVLSALPRNCNRVFPVKSGTVGEAWKRLVNKAGIENLRFHDLRHEAISRFFEMGLSVPEVALISGHRDYRMLFRYTHIRPEDVASKLL